MLNLVRSLSLACCILTLTPGLAQIVPIPAITDAIIASRVIDVSKPVGITTGVAAVNAAGAATYAIPLGVPPGTNGQRPDLALTYSSHGGDGLLGIGWGMQGLSVIQRVGLDNYHDGKTAPVKFTTADRLALDGQRLVATGVPAVYWSATGGYDTENAQLATITPIGTSGTGPAAFKMVAQDGTTRYYGAFDAGSSDALALRSSGTEVCAWLLSQVQDAAGNAIRYHYSNNSLFEAKRPTRIEYSINTTLGIAAYNYVEFYYNTRADKNRLFQSGSEVRNEFLLERIDVTADGTLMKRYDLKYAQRQQNVSYLSEVIEKGVGGATQLNSTIIKYGDLSTPEEFTRSAFPAVAGQNVDIYPCDFDNNGKADLLVANASYDDHGVRYHTGFTVYMNGSTTSTYMETFSGTDISQITTYGGAQQFLTGDFNGDGRNDIMVSRFHWHAPLNKFFFTGVLYYENTTADGDANFTQYNIGRPDASLPYENSYSWLYPEAPREYLFPADFDGDGRTELITFLYDGLWNTNRMYMWDYGTTSGTWVQQTISTSGNHFGNAKHIDVMDLDGDGRCELVSRNETQPTQCHVVSMNTPNTWATITTASSPPANADVFPGDFNGDGRTDLLARTGAAWNIYFSTGTALTGANAVSITETDPSKVRVGDFNGDGRTDICRAYYNSGAAEHRISMNYSLGFVTTGTSFEAKTYIPSPNNALTTLTVGDIDGDGKADLVNRHVYTSPIDMFYFNRRTHERRLDKVVDGMGAQVDFDYGYLVDASVYSEETDVWEFPDHDFDGPLAVASKLKRTNGIGGMNTETHSYKDGWAWTNGPGFMGFTKHKVVDDRSDQQTEVRSLMFTTRAHTLPDRTTVTDVSTGTLLKEVNTTWTSATLFTSTDRYQYRMLESREHDLLSDVWTVNENLLFDAVGNVKSNKVTVGTVLVTETTVPSFNAFGPSACPNKPSSIQTVTTRTGSPAVTVNTSFSYDATTGAVSQRVDFQNKPTQTITDQQYWPAGNLKQTTVYYTGLAVNDRRVTSVTYDAKYRFPATTTQRWNNAGTLVDLVETTTYDPKWGTIASKVGTDQLQTNYTYDAFGRVASVSAPFIPGSPRYTITHQLAWDQVAAERKVYYSLVSDPGAPDEKTWFDLLGREVEKQTSSFAVNAWAKSNVTYDALGRIATTTLPRLTGETAQVITNGYDALGRLQSEANSFSGTTTYGYTYAANKLTTSKTTAAAHVSTSTVDAAGKMVTTHDDGGDLTYTYDSWGNPLTVMHGGLTQVTNTYDAYGRQTKLMDADGGTTEYVYNAFGLLTSQKNANLQTTTFVYDNLGRIKSRTEPEGTTTWTYYYQGGRFIDAPASIVGLGYTMSYDYDEFARLLQESWAGLGKQYHYDAYDRMDFFRVDQAPMQVQVDYAYTGEGHVNTVKVGAETLFQGLSMNGSGRYKQYTLVDGKTTTITYDQQYPLRIQAPSVQDLNMVYNYTTGNLTSRRDAIRARKEEFTYDALDRLITAKTTNVTTSAVIADLTYSYDGSVGGTTKGNLVQRTDIGKFNYSSAHAPTRAFGTTPGSTPPAVISQYTQTVTYNSFLQPVTINEPNAGTGNVLGYAYGPDHQRAKSTWWDGADYPNGPPVEERWYGNGLERQRFDGNAGQDNMVLYVQGGDGICAMIVATSIGGFSQTLHAVYKDHLGSIVALTKKVNNVATIVAEQNFDAWGRKRNPTNWTYTAIPAVPTWLYRGYTGHEHLPEPFALINMNGRMYDPLNGRMLSVDNYVNVAFGTQGVNRYSYAGNNPLKFTDPDGEFIWIPIAAAAIVGAYSGYRVGEAHGYQGMDMAASMVGGAIIAVQAFGFGSMVGAAVGGSMTVAYGGLIGMAAGGAAGGSIRGFGQAAMSGNDPWEGAWKESISGLVGAGVGGYITGGAGALVGGALAGGTSTALQGGDLNEILTSSTIGAASAWGLYQAQMWGAYSAHKSNSGEFTRRQFFAMSRAAQWSFTRGRERGGWIVGDKVVLDPTKGTGDRNDPGPRPPGSSVRFHTHPNIGSDWNESHSPADMRNATKGYYISYVIGRQNTYDFSILRTSPVPTNNEFIRYPYIGY